MAEEYVPAQYWSQRLAGVGGLRSVGHVAYGEAYNGWIYRRKGVVLGRALRQVASVGRALDLGSGVGWVVDQLRRHGAVHVHGIDISPDAVADLRVRFPAFTFDEVRLGEQSLPVVDGSFDVATFLDVSYHIVDDGSWEHAVAEAARALRPGGSLVVIDAFGAEERVPASHVRFRSAGRWHGHARSVGLDHVSTIPCYRWLSRPRDDSVLRVLPQQARGAIEYTLDTVLPAPSHLACTVYARRP